MRGLVAMLALTLFGLTGCADHVSFPAGPLGSFLDDDDSVAPDDDDTTVSDDDDTTPPDDDDTTPADDDDATPPPAFIGAAYCLDWSTVDVTEPEGFLDFLIELGVVFDSSRPVLIPTAVDGSQIWMDVGLALAGCNAGDDFDPHELTTDGPGTWADPHFEAGPGDIEFGGSPPLLTLQAADVTGDFTPSADRIDNSTLVGALDLSALIGACALLDCETCPDGTDQCVGFEADSAQWNRAD